MSEGLHAQGPKKDQNLDIIIWTTRVQGMSVQLQTVAEGHVPGSQGMTKHGPLEKTVANHFSILDSRTP